LAAAEVGDNNDVAVFSDSVMLAADDGDYAVLSESDVCCQQQQQQMVMLTTTMTTLMC
jgi:hypothetical protein